MKTFRELFAQMTCDPAFNALYEKECHVCPHTMRIFEKIGDENIDTAELSETLDVPLKAIDELKDADCCDPHLVIRLCRHLHLAEPERCPRILSRPGRENP